MSLKGNLETFFIASILQLLSLDKKTGILRVKHDNNEAKVYFKGGTIIYAADSRKETRLGHLLKNKGIISAEQFQKCMARAKEQKQSLGNVLLELGYVSREKLEEFKRQQVEDILYTLFLWKKGDFAYKDGLPKIEKNFTNEMDTMELILEASRRVDEMSVLTKQIQSDRIILKISGKVKKVKDSKEIELHGNEWSVLSLIDGKRTVRQVIDESGHDEFSIYKILYTLTSFGLIESSGEAPYIQKEGKIDAATQTTIADRKKILVADDMTQIRKILRFSLREVGYNVVLAEDGEEALQRAFDELNPPDLIILDIMMPKMDGYEVIKRLRESEATMDTPVIFLTAKGQKKDVIKGIEAGANDYVVKPYKFVDLHKKIEKLLKERVDVH
jgi:CheY-like chemotaxis protein